MLRARDIAAMEMVMSPAANAQDIGRTMGAVGAVMGFEGIATRPCKPRNKN